eukprot:8895947-Karenia_brevis.AAC.1
MYQEEDELDAEEAQPVKVPRAPWKPTAKEVEEHEAAGRSTYRDWCAQCKQAHARDRYHKADKEDDPENAVPRL